MISTRAKTPTEPKRRRRLLIGLLLVALGVAAYSIGWQVWGGYHFRAAERALAARDFPSARKHLQHCQRAWPGDADTLLLAAQAARRDGDALAAGRLLRAAREAGALPDAIAMEQNLLRLQGGDMTEADTYLRYCAATPEGSHTALMLEALIVGALQAMDLPHARQGLELWNAQQTEPADQAQALVWSGDLAIRAGDIGQALPFYRQAVEAEPGQVKARQSLADLLSRYEPSEALPHLAMLLHDRPHDPALRLSLARCRRMLGEHEEARALLDPLLQENPNFGAALLERGQLELDLGNAAAAEPYLRRAVEQLPERREPNQALARCLHLAGNDAEASTYQERVTHIDALLDQRAKALRP